MQPVLLRYKDPK